MAIADVIEVQCVLDEKSYDFTGNTNWGWRVFGAHCRGSLVVVELQIPSWPPEVLTMVGDWWAQCFILYMDTKGPGWLLCTADSGPAL